MDEKVRSQKIITKENMKEKSEKLENYYKKKTRRKKVRVQKIITKENVEQRSKRYQQIENNITG